MSANSSLVGSDNCIFPVANLISMSVLIAYIVMMPLFVSVIVVGYQKWRKQRSGSFLTTPSHIDVFTYNVVALDLLAILGTCFYFLWIVYSQENLLKAGTGMFSILLPGQTLFHLITCVERYLAVVHPIFYLRLRGMGGVRVRNAVIGCVWLVSTVVLVLVMHFQVSISVVSGMLLFFTSMAFCFCSLSVLCTLIRPGPGEGGGNRERVDQSKQRAFRTMMILTGVLFLRFFSNLIMVTIQNFSTHNGYLYCVMAWSSLWFFVPSSLVLPLLFLQRDGKLPVCGPKFEESA